jgi:transcriptional regulator with XRE-family HTH domain
MKKNHVKLLFGGEMLNNKMQFSLKELRARKNYTQEKVARDLGVSVQTYSAWEKDISNVAVSKVKAVADYFGVSLSEIFFKTNMKKNHV